MRFRSKTMTVNPASVGCISYGPDSEVAALVTPLSRIRAGLSHPANLPNAGDVVKNLRRRRNEDTLNLR